MILSQRFSILALLLMIYSNLYAQSGLSVSPPRNYFTVAVGQSESKKVLVSNPSKTSRLDLAVSLNDWSYDNLGNNVIYDAGTRDNSCANWISIAPQSFFSLAPGESYEMELIVSIPNNLNTTIPVHTAMLYITQINPEDAVNEHGTNIKVSVRTGIKIYQRFPGPRLPELEIQNFTYDKENLILDFDNTGNIWADGTLTCELINQETGKKTSLPDTVFYTIPKDQRKVVIALPVGLEKGKYIATSMLNYGENATIKMAELSFTHE